MRGSRKRSAGSELRMAEEKARIDYAEFLTGKPLGRWPLATAAKVVGDMIREGSRLTVEVQDYRDPAASGAPLQMLATGLRYDPKDPRLGERAAELELVPQYGGSLKAGDVRKFNVPVEVLRRMAEQQLRQRGRVLLRLTPPSSSAKGK